MYERLMESVGRVRGFEPQAVRLWFRKLFTELAFQDWFVLGYFVVLLCAAGLAPDSPARTVNLGRLSALAMFFATVVVLHRGSLFSRPFIAPLLYRFSVLGAVLGSYFMLQGLLPIVNTRVLDGPLYALDLRLFGVEPTLWFDQFVTPHTTEWFAFFYYSYFFILAAYVLPYVFLGKDMQRFAEFGLGFMFVYCVAHTTYMLVPGYGPYWYLADSFQNPLPMGFWYERVLEAVNSAGAHKDIFPSLHTAGPTFCFIFAMQHRKHAPFKFTWIPTGFFAANIILATMFLRWHYVIDIVAGVTLATSAHLVSRWISRREAPLRVSRGVSPVWTSLFNKSEPTSSENSSRVPV